MWKILAVIVVGLTLTDAIHAQESQIVALRLRPAAEPRPALKHPLTPQWIDLTAGNAAALYRRAMLIMAQNRSPQANKAWEWLDLPDDKFPVAEARQFVAGYAGVLKEVAAAAYREHCDWELPLRSDAIFLLLPDVQAMRPLARLVQLKARVHILSGELAEAIETMRIGFAQARHIADGPTLVNGLVGVSIAEGMLAEVERLIARPDAPNLYWSLSSLPASSLVDLRRALQVESALLRVSFPELRDLGAPRTPAQWRGLFDQVVEQTRTMARDLGLAISPEFADLAPVAAALYIYPHAKRRLRDAGRSPEEVEAMPVAQVVLVDWVEAYEARRDEMLKWFALPYWEAGPGLQAAAQALDESRGESPQADLLLPALGSCRAATARLESTIARLRAIEALRAYAATHDGKFPARLADVTATPIPVDPISGRPWDYQATPTGAVLRPTPVRATGQRGVVEYRLQIR